MTSMRGWGPAGVVTGLTGLAVSQLVAALLSVREGPFVAVVESIITLVPGPVASWAIDFLGSRGKPVLVVLMTLSMLVLFSVAGWLWPRVRWASTLIWVSLSAVGLAAVVARNGTGRTETLPIGVGLVVWLLAMTVLSWVAGRAKPSETGSGATAGPSRRGFAVAVGVVAALGLGSGVGARLTSGRKAAIKESRRLLRIPGVTARKSPARARIGVPGVQPWRTRNDDFYQVHTALVIPAIEPAQWRLRIHGMVEREIVLTYDDLIARGLTEAWMTLSCVSNEVGGQLVGNAWWSGVLTSELLAEARPMRGADAVLQTSEDGWTCSTPLSAMTDDRNSMFAVAMNGQPLPLEHGFPVRTVVPGLYGYTSACKWLVDVEVTRFADVEAYWTERGWAEQAPVRLTSRIDVPRPDDEVEAGVLTVGGSAWRQNTGIEAVEVALDGGAWRRARVAQVNTADTWVQWAAAFDVEPGPHVVRVRAIDRDGEVQTGVVRDVLPDGATGWHAVEFTAV
ncbi:molybdopterin-dependent oxidoreductase [Nocardioides gilvus]|uniref:molybdopterin-dependent oxidoreductase n=1 Tax=Nocardioides gilvus TaxID=1735589 RepID=UPI000D742F45|nr:molybdopterin-dependent oxidoreductase [Nocardioides gilvus]